MTRSGDYAQLLKALCITAYGCAGDCRRAGCRIVRHGDRHGRVTTTDTSDFVGAVRCTASAEGEGAFTGVAVELDAGNQIFTTLPVVPVPERMSQE